MSKQSRSILQGYFTTGSKPTQEDFDNFIDSGINQTDDNITVSSDQNVGFGDDTPISKVSIKTKPSKSLKGTVSSSGTTFTVSAEFTMDQILVGDTLEIAGNSYVVASIPSAKIFTTLTTPALPISNQSVSKIFSALSVQSSKGSSQFYIDPNGKVGVGTNNPSEILDVNGTIVATKFSGDGSALTNIPISALEAGDINFPDNTVTAQSFTGSASGLTSIPSSELSGDIKLPKNVIQAQSFIGDGSKLTGINASSNGIQYFKVDQPCIDPGTQITLSWNAPNANYVELTYLENYIVTTLTSQDPLKTKIFPEQIGKKFSPNLTQVYTLTAYKLPDGSKPPSKSNKAVWTDQVQVQVTVLPPLKSFMRNQKQHHNATPAVINAGETFTFLRDMTQANVYLLAISMNKIYEFPDLANAITSYYQNTLNYPWSSTTNGEWITDAINKVNNQN